MIDLEAKYPGKVEPADADYPSGRYKNETSPGLFNGTPFEKAAQNDLNAFMQGLIKAAGITLSGNADTVLVSQILQGLLYQSLTADLFEDSGAADTYVLSPLTNNYAPHAYKNGAKYRWVPANANTGASTVDISSLGAKNIFLKGAALLAGVLATGFTYEIEYDLANDRFNLLPSGDIQTNGVDYFKTKTLDIGDWNMDTTAAVDVTHGVDHKKIRSIDVIIRDDTDAIHQPIDRGFNDTNPTQQGAIGSDSYSSTAVRITRLAAPSAFDNAAYDSTSFNRGWVPITYLIT